MGRVKTIRESEKINYILTWVIAFLISFNILAWMNNTLVVKYESLLLLLNIIVLLVSLPFLVKFEQRELSIYLAMAMLFPFQVISIIITSGGFGLLAMYLLLCISILILKNIKFDYKQEMIIISSVAIVFIYRFIYSTGKLDNAVFFDGYLNPNLVGRSIVYLSIFLYLYCIDKTILLKKIAYVSLSFSLLATIFLNSRASMIVIILFIISQMLIPYLHPFKTKWLKLSMLIILLGSIVVPGIIVYISNNDIFINTTIFGKDLYTGREILWKQFFESFDGSKEKIIFGLGTNIKWWKGHHMHNDSLNLIQHFGLIGFILHSNLIFQITKVATNIGSLDLRKTRVLFSLISIIIFSYFEIIIFRGRFILLFSILLSLLLNENYRNQGKVYY